MSDRVTRKVCSPANKTNCFLPRKRRNGEGRNAEQSVEISWFTNSETESVPTGQKELILDFTAEKTLYVQAAVVKNLIAKKRRTVVEQELTQVTLQLIEIRYNILEVCSF